MARHPFDPVSLVLGGVALAAGVIVLAGGSVTEEARVLLPAGLIGVGLALLVKVISRSDEPAPAASWGADDPFATSPADPAAGGGSDLDHLFAPVDDVLSTWGTERPATAGPAGESTGDTEPATPAGPDEAGTAERE